MVLGQLCFRAWAAFGAYFYSDDFRLVDESSDGLSWSLLVSPYDAQFMPVGRLVAWFASWPEHLSYPVLALSSVVMQLGASVACMWMLSTLFGWRWGILAPLALYLTSAMTMAAFLWWAAALNQLPLQAVFFAAVATWVRYLRDRRARWLGATMALLVLGLLCYVKTLLVFPVLAALAVGWFAGGGPVRRTSTVLRRYWPAALAGVSLGGGFLTYYVLAVPQLATGSRPTGAWDLFDEMVGSSFASAAVGGPWRWDDQIAPAAQADPPALAVHLAWVVLALVVAGLALRRERTLRAWVLLGGYLGAAYVLLLTTRAQAVGSVVGTEYRYLTDSAPVLVLCLSLAAMGLRRAEQPSRARDRPMLTLAPRPAVVVLAVLAVAGSGLWSSWSYARVWHTQHPASDYLGRALDDLAGGAVVDLADQDVPAEVMAPFSAPYQRTSVLLPLLSAVPRFPASTERLHVLAEDGSLRAADLQAATTSHPGRTAGCGWRVGDAGRRIPLRASALERNWWLRIDYLASGDSGALLETGVTRRPLDLQQGLHRLFVEVEGGLDAVSFSGLDPGVVLCVDQVVVGVPVPADQVDDTTAVRGVG